MKLKTGKLPTVGKLKSSQPKLKAKLAVPNARLPELENLKDVVKKPDLGSDMHSYLGHFRKRPYVREGHNTSESDMLAKRQYENDLVRERTKIGNAFLNKQVPNDKAAAFFEDRAAQLDKELNAMSQEEEQRAREEYSRRLKGKLYR